MEDEARKKLLEEHREEALHLARVAGERDAPEVAEVFVGWAARFDAQLQAREEVDE